MFAILDAYARSSIRDLHSLRTKCTLKGLKVQIPVGQELIAYGSSDLTFKGHVVIQGRTQDAKIPAFRQINVVLDEASLAPPLVLLACSVWVLGLGFEAPKEVD